MPDGSAFCTNCGQPVLGGAPLATAAPGRAVAAGTYSPVTFTPAAASVAYAGFWLRVVAHLVDGLIQGICFVVILIPLAILMGVGSAIRDIRPNEDPSEIFASGVFVTFFLGFFLICIAGGWLYSALLESSEWQGTVGKKMLGLKVTDLAGQQISFWHATGRFFSKMISGLIPFGIGYIMAGFTEKKQALHDMIAGTLVMRS